MMFLICINSLIFLLVVFVFIVCYLIKKIKKYKFVIGEYDLKYNSPKSFTDLCIKINLLLYQNHKTFIQNAPFKQEHVFPIQETDNWHQIEETIINPNNKKILDLIKNNIDLIPTKDRNLFLKMEQHIVSFDKHIMDRTFDYSKNIFPKDFEKLIKSECSDINKKEIVKIVKWLNKNFKISKIKVIKKYIFGSILENYYKYINDVDILILYNEQNISEIKKISSKIKLIKSEFYKHFKKKLEIQAHSKSEENEFNSFLDSLQNKKEI